MMRNVLQPTRWAAYIKLILVAALLCSGFAAPPASAATPGSLYSYSLDGSSSTVSNGAAANSSTSLKLHGNWSQSAFGVHFDGNTTNKQSVGYAKPSSGATVNVAANKAFGGAVKFKYQKPGGNCFGDSRNVTQIGRFGAGLGQIKMQLSNCGVSSSQVFLQCRIAGSNSTTSDFPVTSTVPLIEGEEYIASCAKVPDPAWGSGTLEIAITHLDAANGNQTTTENFSITRPGTITAWGYLSVANKYKLPSISQNTDQFVGDIAKVAFCEGATLSAAKDCLSTEIPAGSAPADPEPTPEPEPEPQPEPTPTPAEFIGNQSLETDMNGWTGMYNTTSVNSRIADGYDGIYSLRSVNNTSYTNSNGFIDKPRWFDGSTGKATVDGKAYTGSVWVKPDHAGQSLRLYLRERSASGATVGSRTVTHTATSTDWVQLVNDYTAEGTGNSIGFYVFAHNVYAHQGFQADMISLTTEE